MDGVAHSGSISVLDDLVVGLVSGSSGQEGRDSDKSLERNKGKYDDREQHIGSILGASIASIIYLHVLNVCVGQVCL